MALDLWSKGDGKFHGGVIQSFNLGGKLIPFLVEQALNWFSEFAEGIGIPSDPPAPSGNIQTASAWVPQQGENIKINCNAAVKGDMAEALAIR
ncbi:hypothetical protein LguiA_008175 [Lonicera macranthoides]